jgi:cytoskeletal protein RodZ
MMNQEHKKKTTEKINLAKLESSKFFSFIFEERNKKFLIVALISVFIILILVAIILIVNHFGK